MLCYRKLCPYVRTYVTKCHLGQTTRPRSINFGERIKNCQNEFYQFSAKLSTSLSFTFKIKYSEFHTFFSKSDQKKEKLTNDVFGVYLSTNKRQIDNINNLV